MTATFIVQEKGKAMNPYLRAASCCALLALTATGALAQTAASPANPPATLGTTPQEAAEATQKAVPRSDTATVVRTAPSAADKASAALNDTTTTRTGNAGTGTGNTATTAPTDRPVVMRTARADRN
jgi:hypothetical protein